MTIKSLIKSAIYPLYEKRLLNRLDLAKTPRHIGVILDGNRRWSKENPSPTGDTSPRRGHIAGAEKILESSIDQAANEELVKKLATEL